MSFSGRTRRWHTGPTILLYAAHPTGIFISRAVACVLQLGTGMVRFRAFLHGSFSRENPLPPGPMLGGVSCGFTGPFRVAQHWLGGGGGGDDGHLNLPMRLFCTHRGPVFECTIDCDHAPQIPVAFSPTAIRGPGTHYSFGGRKGVSTVRAADYFLDQK